MATTVADPVLRTRPSPGLPGRRYDHWFFTGMALVMLLTVFFGFARSYYLAGVFSAPLPSMIVHLHGAAFSCWILLLITQTTLVSAGRVDIHRQLGIAGFLLGCLMVILGVGVATDSLVRMAGPPGRDPRAFYIVPMADMLTFSVILYYAFRRRADSAAHKRLIYVATTTLLVAAIARIPVAFSHRKIMVAMALSNIFLVVLAGYDLWSMRRLHRATVWASGFLIFVQQVRMPIGRTAAWHSFAVWVQNYFH